MSTASRFTLIVAAPPTGVAILWASVLAFTALTGTHPIWNIQPGNLAEAAVLQDGAAVMRFVEQRQDINAMHVVRSGVMSRTPQTLTPIEAAAASREAEMVQLLVDLGATPDAAAWQRAFCISDADRVRDVLSAHRPAGALEACAEER